MEEKKVKSKTDHSNEIESVKLEYAAAQDAVALNKVKKNIHVLKTKIRAAGDTEGLKKLLVWERQRGLLNASDEYDLNKIELEELNDECECFQKIPAAGIPAEIGGRYKFKTYFDETRKTEMFTIYIPRTILPEEQIDSKLAWKISQGFMPEAKDYAPEKVLVRRVTLRESEWKRYFRMPL